MSNLSNYYFEPANLLHNMLKQFDPVTGSSRGMGTLRPEFDIVETKEHFCISMDLPGVRMEDIAISLHYNVLSISGERHRCASKQDKACATDKTDKTEHHKDHNKDYKLDQDKKYLRRERAFGNFLVSITLPEGVDENQIKANLDHGVLKIMIHKQLAAQQKKIPIQVSESK